MIVPERKTKTGRVVPAFQVDDCLAEDVLKHSWITSPKGYVYRVATVKNKRTTILLHRQVFLMAYGRWPSVEIDHISRDKLDNRVANLREVNAKENAANKDNSYVKKTTGTGTRGRPLPTGVYFRRGRYYAQIQHNKKQKYLGSSETVDGAKELYLKALKEISE
jgi:hypothetical protein